MRSARAEEGGSGLEILLLRRSRKARFGAGAYAFPGGAIDAADASPFWDGRVPAVGEPVACVAALREFFEETGFLPASGAAGALAPERLSEARADLLADRTSFARVAADLQLNFGRAPMVYFARWITPREFPLRFDTRFFLFAGGLLSDHVPAGGEPDLPATLSAEHEEAQWIAPGAALRKSAAGQMPMLFPTIRTVERLAGLASPAAALKTLRGQSVEPALVKLEDGAGPEPRRVAPGDAGYDDLP